MDWARYSRALSAQSVLNTEEARELQLSSKYQPTPQEWEAILQHDRWMTDEEPDLSED